ncbi:hypothetical protein HZP19_03465 [Elizabethkingia anophelis]|nr:hypothetical protein [Elizabethkingia anophelis]
MKMTTIISPVYCAAGSPCPESGIWKNEGFFHTSIIVSKGNIMPNYCGVPVTWELLWRV